MNNKSTTLLVRVVLLLVMATAISYGFGNYTNTDDFKDSRYQSYDRLFSECFERGHSEVYCAGFASSKT